MRDDTTINREYHRGALQTGPFPYGWGETALREHLYKENVTPWGKARAAQELAERAEMRERNRSPW